MNDKRLDKQIRKDVDQVKKDVSVLMRDSAARLHITDGKASKDLIARVDETVSQLSKDVEKLSGTARDTAATMSKGFGARFNEYNTKAQDLVVKVPASVSKRASRNPWAVIAICLAAGLMLGFVIKPSPRFR
jgi:hypothetical protein